MSFSHPLARKAKVWPMTSQDGSERHVLVIETTVALDPKDDKFKKKLVDRLSEAAMAYVADHFDITDFILINRPKDWEA
jgi:hemerythrin